MERERADGREENRVRESSSRPGDSGRRGWCEDGECGRAWRSGRAIPFALSSLSLSLRGRWAGPRSRFSEGPLPTLRLVSSRRVASRGPHLWFWHSTLACATRVRASDVSPLVAQPKWSSISMIFSTLDGTSKVDVSRFSTARTTPSLVLIPIAVVPSCVARTNAREKKGDGRRSVQVQQKRVRSSSAVSLTGRPEPWRSSLP